MEVIKERQFKSIEQIQEQVKKKSCPVVETEATEVTLDEPQVSQDFDIFEAVIE